MNTNKELRKVQDHGMEEYKVIPNPQTYQIVKEQSSKMGISIEQYGDMFLQWVGLCTITNANWKEDSDRRFHTWVQTRLAAGESDDD